ncbi:unnamed protein product, partial [Ectocarpus fasciculatus]
SERRTTNKQRCPVTGEAVGGRRVRTATGSAAAPPPPPARSPGSRHGTPSDAPGAALAAGVVALAAKTTTTLPPAWLRDRPSLPQATSSSTTYGTTSSPRICVPPRRGGAVKTTAWSCSSCAASGVFLRAGSV